MNNDWWMEEIPWLIDELPTIASMLAWFQDELETTQHDKLRLYINNKAKEYTLFSFTTAISVSPDNQEPLTKDKCTHHAIIRNFYQIDFDKYPVEKLAKVLLNSLEIYWPR